MEFKSKTSNIRIGGKKTGKQLIEIKKCYEFIRITRGGHYFYEDSYKVIKKCYI